LGVYARSGSLRDIIGEEFPELLVMEYLSGGEYSVDCLRHGDTTLAIPRKRDLIRTGITFNGTTVEDNGIIEASKVLAQEMELEYAFGFQFKRDERGKARILESNPRVQGTMVAATFAGANIIYASVKAALDENLPPFKIKWGTRIMRYWGGMGTFNGKLSERMSI